MPQCDESRGKPTRDAVWMGLTLRRFKCCKVKKCCSFRRGFCRARFLRSLYHEARA